MKRVLHVLSSLERSGMEIMLLNSYPEWQKLGYKCDVVATADRIGPLAPALQEAGYNAFHVPFRSKIPYVPSFSFMGRFYSLCSSGYDVVHIHTEAAAPLFTVLAKLAGVKTVALTNHNVFRFNGLLRLRKRVERWLIRAMGGRFGLISESVARCEAERFGNKGTAITNWFDTQHFRPPSDEERTQARNALNVAENSFVIVSVGNCSPVKNHGAILQALALKPIAAPVTYLHVGRETTDESEKRLAGELGVQESVDFFGSVPNPRPYHWAADAFVMPSLNEGFSIAALEAIATGLPAILADVDGLRDLPAVASNVVLIAPEAQALARALHALNQMDPVIRRDRALADSTAVREHFSVENGVLSVTASLYSLA